MTSLLIICKDCRREVWMTPRDYIKWRCPHCNGYPAVKEAKRDKITASLPRVSPVKADNASALEASHNAAEKEPVLI